MITENNEMIIDNNKMVTDNKMIIEFMACGQSDVTTES